MLRLEQRQIAEIGIKSQLPLTLAGLGDIADIHQQQRFGRAGAYARRALDRISVSVKTVMLLSDSAIDGLRNG